MVLTLFQAHFSPPTPKSADFLNRLIKKSPYEGYQFSLFKGVKALEIAVGAVFSPTRFSLVRLEVASELPLREQLSLQFSSEILYELGSAIANHQQSTLTIGPASYRGPERRTLKTAGRAAKQPKNSCFACFGCFSAVFPALRPGPTRHLFRLFFGCFSAVFKVRRLGPL